MKSLILNSKIINPVYNNIKKLNQRTKIMLRLMQILIMTKKFKNLYHS